MALLFPSFFVSIFISDKNFNFYVRLSKLLTYVINDDIFLYYILISYADF